MVQKLQQLRALNRRLSDERIALSLLSLNGAEVPEELRTRLFNLERFLDAIEDARIFLDQDDLVVDAAERRQERVLLERYQERCRRYALETRSKLERAQRIVRDGSRKIEAIKDRLLDPNCCRQDIWRMLVTLEHWLDCAAAAVTDDGEVLDDANWSNDMEANPMLNDQLTFDWNG